MTRPTGFGFTLEALHPFRIACKKIGQYLDGHFAIESRILRAIDLTHAASTKRRKDLVGTKFRTGLQRHGSAHCREERRTA